MFRPIVVILWRVASSTSWNVQKFRWFRGCTNFNLCVCISCCIVCCEIFELVVSALSPLEWNGFCSFKGQCLEEVLTLAGVNVSLEYISILKLDTVLLRMTRLTL